MAKDAQKPITERIRRIIEVHEPYWRSIRSAMSEEGAFLDGDRYVDDTGSHVRDRRQRQIRGQETQDTIRHIAAKATEKPRSIEARAIDQDQDPDTAEMAVALLEWELGNPWKDYDGAEEDAIVACRETRLGVVMMDWLPGQGEFGEILYRYADGRRIMWEPPYNPHHPLCGWLHEEKRVDCDEANDTYGVDWIKPDRDSIGQDGISKPGLPVMRGVDGQEMAPPDDNKATLWFMWFKNDKTLKDTKKETTRRPLEPSARYMSCTDGCGYRTPTQGELQKKQIIPGGLPEEMAPDPTTGEGGCPICGGNMTRIDALAQDASVLAYSRGKRLVVMAPFSPNPNGDEPVADGQWPIPTARSFPIFAITAYAKPGRPVGPSDTFYMWDQQLASDELMTQAVQAIFEHRNYWELPRDGIYNGKGQRFSFRDDDFNVMYRDATKARFGPLEVKLHTGTGLDPAWQIGYQAVQEKLTANRGVTDFGPSDESLNQQSGAALQQRAAIGEIPVAHFNRRKNRERAKFYGVVWDYIRATYTSERLNRLRMNGIDLSVKLQGDDLPNFDFILTDTPNFTGLEEARAKAFDGLLQAFAQAVQMGLDPIAVTEIYAEVNQLPQTIVRKFQKMLQAQQEQQQEMQMQQAAAALGGAPGGQGGVNPGEGPGGPGMAPPSQSSPNGNGNSAVPVG